MAAVLNILDLLDLTCGTKLQAENVKEYSLKLILQILIQRLNLTDLKIDFTGEDLEIIQGVMNLKGQFSENELINPTEIISDGAFQSTDDPKIGILSTIGMGKDEERKDVESRKVVDCNSKEPYFSLHEPFVPKKMTISDSRSQIDKSRLSLVPNGGLQNNTSMDFAVKTNIQLFPSVIVLDNQPSAAESRQSMENSRLSVTRNHSSFTRDHSARTHSFSEADNGSFLEEREDLPSSIEDTPILNEFSKEYEDFKNIVNKMQEIFGKDINETLKHIKQAADLAENNRLRQIYFHEEIYKKIQLPDTEEDFTPVRKGPREIVIKKAMELVAEQEEDVEAKIGDLSASKEKLIRDENLLFKLVEQVYTSGKKSKEEPRWSVTKPVESPQDITIKKLNEIIKEHEDIKCYIEFLIYHINTLADFSEISIPIIFANDPQMEGIQQRIREVRLTPSEYIVTKKIQRDLMEFYKTFISRIDNVENRLNSNSIMILKHNDELYEKTATQGSFINDIQISIKSISENLENLMENASDSEGKVKKTLTKFQEEVNNINKDQITVLEKQKKMLSELQILECSLLKLKDEIFHLKAVKLEKIELQKLLSTKADCSLLHSKVSEAQFSLAYNDLTSGLNSISSQIGAQNFIWEALFKKITEKLNIVVAKNEFEKFKIHMADAIKELQRKLAKLHEKDDIEAIGTKTKFLRNLTCLSCNKGRTMKVANDYPNFPALKKLPSKGYKKDPTNSSSEFTDRYVGGNHTSIKPKEKVFRSE